MSMFWDERIQIKARNSVERQPRGPGLNQGRYPHFGWSTIRGARKEDRGVKTRTMKWFKSFRGKDGCGIARRCRDMGKI